MGPVDMDTDSSSARLALLFPRRGANPAANQCATTDAFADADRCVPEESEEKQDPKRGQGAGINERRRRRWRRRKKR